MASNETYERRLVELKNEFVSLHTWLNAGSTRLTKQELIEQTAKLENLGRLITNLLYKINYEKSNKE